MVLQNKGINLQDLLLGKRANVNHLSVKVVTATHFIEGNKKALLFQIYCSFVLTNLR